jgi:hypothetical protein
MESKNWWHGYIIEFDSDQIVCVLKKDYKLDKLLTYGRGNLKLEQDNMVTLGLMIKFNIKTKKIKFLMWDAESWI